MHIIDAQMFVNKLMWEKRLSVQSAANVIGMPAEILRQISMRKDVPNYYLNLVDEYRNKS